MILLMKYKCILTLFVFLFIAIDCNHCNTKNIQDLDYTNITFSELPLDVFLGRPLQILVKDSLFFITDRTDEKLITIFDYKNNKLIKRIFSIGQGPNDLLWPIITSLDNNLLSIFERQNGRYRQYKIQDLLNSDSISCVNEIIFENSDRLAQTKNGFVTSGFYDRDVYCLLNKKGEIIHYLDPFDGKFNALNIAEKFKVEQGVLNFCKQTNMLVIATYFTGDIFIYIFNDKNDSFEKKSISLTNKKITTNNSDMNFNENTIYHSSDICSANNTIYVLYNGFPMKERAINPDRYILSIDSEGKLKKIFKTRQNIEAIYVADNCIYAISVNKDGEYVVVMFEL